MSCSPTFKWIVPLLLVLTLGWKWAASSQVFVSTEADEQVAAAKVAGFLARNYFNVVGPENVMFGLQLIHATAGACDMRVAISSSRGWHRDLIRNFAKPTDRTFVVFGGTIYPRQPIWRTVPDFLWSRFLGKLGVNIHPRPVITVLAGPDCDAMRLAWSELD